MVTATNTTAFDSQIAWAQTQSAETIAAQECCETSTFWHIATVVGMVALAAFGLFLVVEWPILAIPVCAIIVGKFAIDLINMLRNCCSSAPVPAPNP